MNSTQSCAPSEEAPQLWLVPLTQFWLAE